ncbi:Uncharacterized protein XB17_01105 [Leptospira santarosai]|nr:Uncharacterized protein XB17_01105 [Leptospira santarosai]
MIILKALIVFEILIFGNLLLAQQTIQKPKSDLGKQVSEEVKKIRELSGESESSFFELPGRDTKPILKLEKMGMAIIPVLLPYLSDTSQTGAVRAHGNGKRRITLVNEYIGYIINRIANHTFYLPGKIGEDDGISLGDYGLVDMDRIRSFQTLVANWYQKYKNKSPEERKREEYRLCLENKIKELFDYYSSDESEMIESATALGKIGNPKSAKTLRKVANYVSSYLFYKKEETSLTIH